MKERTKLEGWIDEEEENYDAVVVGSGYGGSVAACRMSMAGIKVCLIEKGRRWEAHDFPTDSLKIISAVRMESQNLNISCGSKDALFQVYEQNDSAAVVACGLGGGSLVNAGVMLPTPVRARRNSKWPKEWEKDWDVCQASAESMLRVEKVPVKFPAAKVMDQVADREFKENLDMKLSINFDAVDPMPGSRKLQQMDGCLGCGNCLSGCPYNAKNSTDKTYLATAMQEGCIIKTKCEVQYVVKNDICQQGGKISGRRRWRLYLNEINYITSDFVILSAGVFGTSKILFQSQMRGLRLSKALGCGFSCNGNTVAYLAGSSAPLNAYGLDRKKLPNMSLRDRPGPSISSSYTSSLGFTIQSAVLPVGYPHLLFKGITTYGWPTGFCFIHGIIDKLKCVMGLKSDQAIILNAMGYDESDGRLTFERATKRICFSPPHDPLLARKIKAFQKLTKRLGGILFVSRYRSTSVHLLGGCNASSDSTNGVCHPNGQIYDPEAPASVHPGLYVCDASLIPCSVGINPSLTIATAAEHVSRHLVQDILKYKSKNDTECLVKTLDQNPDSVANNNLHNHERSTVVFKETMRGFVGGIPCTAYLKMKMNSWNEKHFEESSLIIGDFHPLLRGKIGGYVVLRGIEKDDLHVIDGDINLCQVDYKTPYTQYMCYHLLLAASSGSRYILEGKKIMNPYLFALYSWRETTTLHVTLRKVIDESPRDEMVNLKGELNISLIELFKSVASLTGNRKGRFICLLASTILRTYIIQIPRWGYKNLILSADFYHKAYQREKLHEIKTGDGIIISCRQWNCNQNSLEFKGKGNPVLLLNGHSTESYWLPTEPNDLVRTLLEEGHETWLLLPRLHPLNASNSFTIDDIGRFDIPAAINKILEMHGPSTKIHIIAHCVGGLAIHVALMGGHVSAAHIASLSCTNSSMFFKLNALSKVKMWLPLIPMSMVMLGKNRILPLSATSGSSSGHRILRAIAHFIPRYERCTCDECEVFSGIFGNTFWHENISSTMHHWIIKESLPRLPMAAFPHLRKICNAGFIVDSHGDNSYMIHPERMALPTLYISGGRSLLVTPETSFLANRYMKVHQPGFRHERVVVDGFGHSDLLVGEESYKKVFPHILSHISLAEKGENVAVTAEMRYSREALDWDADPYEEYGGFGSWFLFWVLLLSFIMLATLLLF
ncbi:Long-chain-alcohol oxidase FAO4B [Quillaja saponaria]|uniref:Cholesterol oxidase n=1 Tax=Quillaja saponaria TaxID=32244 RepID=A0AAD7Q791_QUISA|nr:Long-chain-alcohol oxidase FAO4B [Quillaja saponaria]